MQVWVITWDRYLRSMLPSLYWLEMGKYDEKVKTVFVQSPKGWDDNVIWLSRSMLPSLLLVSLPCLKGLSLPMSRIKVRLPNASRVEMIMWDGYRGQCGPLYCLYLLVLLLCLKGLPMSRIKVRLPSAPRVEMMMWDGYHGKCDPLYCLYLLVLLLCLKGLGLPRRRIKVRLPSAPRVEMIMWDGYRGQFCPLHCCGFAAVSKRVKLAYE